MTVREQRDLTPREAAERFLNRYEGDYADETVRNYRHRLREFVHWAEEHEEVEHLRDLDGFLIDEYTRYLKSQDHAPTTTKGKLTVLAQLLKYGTKIEVVERHTPHLVELPRLTDAEETSDQMLDSDDARTALAFFRESTRRRGTRDHVVLELIWHVGARISCLRALDLGDWVPEERKLRFRSRSGTELKRGARHERNVVVSEPVADALEFWIARERPQKRDERGRKPLLTTSRGRASGSTIQTWAYLATQPCLYIECPHNRRRASCRYTQRAHASKCPSSRSPHPIRAGSITWQLNNGLSYEKVASRVAAEPSTIRRYYDKPDHDEELERRLPETEDLDIETSPEWT